MNKSIFYLFGVLFIFSYCTKAQTEKYRLTYNDNPATTISIGWVQNSKENSTVYYGEKDFNAKYKLYKNQHKPDKIIKYKGSKHYFANLKNLKPNTIYYFVIKSGTEISKRFWFKTIPDMPDERLSVIMGGDSRTNRKIRRLANKMVAKLQAHFVIFDGDFTVKGSGKDWRKWLDDWQLTIDTSGRIIPIIAVQGNHETAKDIYKIFNVPNDEIYYSLNFGGNLFHATILNSEIKISGKQTIWLKNDLENNKNSIWKTAVYHKPMRPHYSKKREGNSQYKNWANLFYENSVNLVVEGDSHVCKITWPIKPSDEKTNDEGFVKDEKGTVYIGEGTWGAPVRKADDLKNWTRNASGINQLKWVFIDKNKIEIRTVKYENVKMIKPISTDKMFEIPKGINLWKTGNKDVIRIFKH